MCVVPMPYALRRPMSACRWVRNGKLECLEILADGTSRVLTQVFNPCTLDPLPCTLNPKS